MYTLLYCSWYFTTEEILLKTQLEQMSFLSKNGAKVKEKDVRAKLGDNVSFKVFLLFLTQKLKVT